ncbi:MAG: hypothetical protein IH962_06000, partial [Chloroflexi bacterium]|nr:hypothetical protein [Chloroflexota bacterium]
MAGEEEKKEEEQFDFDSAGEALGYITLEQARIVAIRHARENRDFYGRRFARRDMIWEEVGAREGEDYYYIRLSYRPSGRFRGEPGIEQITIDKAGPVELREIIQEIVEPRNWVPILAAGGTLALVVAVVGGLFAADIIPPSPSPTPVPSVGAPKPAGTVSAPLPTVQPGVIAVLPPTTPILSPTSAPTSTPVPPATAANTRAPKAPTATPTPLSPPVVAVVPDPTTAPTPTRPSPTTAAPLPDLTVELLYPPTIVDCSGGPGNCNIRVDLKIDNLGEGIAPDGIRYTVEAEGVPALSLTTGEGGAIGPGGSTGGFFVTLGPGADCFNPDCTVTVTVDPDNAIVESDETNNTATRTDVGNT